MGFFKKITKGVKKFVKKNIRFKNLVKLGAMVDPTGVVSGLQANHEAKKAEREQLAQMEAENARFAQMSNTEKVDQLNNAMLSKSVPIKDILLSAAGGALSGAGVALAGDTNVTTATSNLADGTITQTIKKNWAKYLGWLAIGAIAITALVKLVFKPKTRLRRR